MIVRDHGINIVVLPGQQIRKLAPQSTDKGITCLSVFMYIFLQLVCWLEEFTSCIWWLIEEPTIRLI